MLAAMVWATCVGLTATAAAAATSGVGAGVGCATSGFALRAYGLNSAYTCLYVEGADDTVSSMHVSWTGAGTICNYQLQLRWYTIHNRRYETDTSGLHVGCRAANAVWAKRFGRHVRSPRLGRHDTGLRQRPGRVCAYVIENGRVRRGVPCVSIHP